MLEDHADVLRFVRLFNARRVLRDVKNEHGRVSLIDLLKGATHAWHGTKLNEPDWSEDSHSIALTCLLREEPLSFYLILNAYWESRDFQLPPLGDKGRTPWRRWIDTSLESPSDIVPWETAPLVSESRYEAAPRSVVLLIAPHENAGQSMV
jgi:glycogen operon protein